MILTALALASVDAVVDLQDRTLRVRRRTFADSVLRADEIAKSAQLLQSCRTR